MKTRLRVTTAVFAAGGLLLLGLGAASASNGAKAPDLSKLAAAKALVAGKAANAALLTGPAKSEAVFVAITPCRVADTRIAGGALGNNSSRGFYVRGTAGFNTQGGKVGGCGVPSSATAVTTNVTIPAVSGGGGYMIGWPYGTTTPHTNFVTYPANQTVTVNPTLALSTGGADPSLAIKNVGHTAHVLIDVTGYFAPQMEGSVSPSGTLYAGTARMVSAAHGGTGVFTVHWDTDVTYCTPTVTPYGGAGYYAEAYNFSGTATTIYVWYLSGSTLTPVDQYVNVAVTC
jgi:hypothetical protein